MGYLIHVLWQDGVAAPPAGEVVAADGGALVASDGGAVVSS